MKKIYVLTIALFLVASSLFAVESIVFVDLERTFNEFYKTQLAKSKIAVQQKDIDAERQLMVDEVTTISDEVDTLKKEARDVTLESEIRDSKRISYEERLLELREKNKAVKEFTERRAKQLQMQVSRMSQTIMDEIRQTVVEYAKQEGIQAVVDSSTRRQAIGVFIYTHPDVDITETILVVLNSKRPDVMEDDPSLDEASETDELLEETESEAVEE